MGCGPDLTSLLRPRQPPKQEIHYHYEGDRSVNITDSVVNRSGLADAGPEGPAGVAGGAGAAQAPPTPAAEAVRAGAAPSAATGAPGASSPAPTFRVCPYCGSRLELPAPPRFCPYCTASLAVDRGDRK